MTQFCNAFCFTCDKCKAAEAEVKRDEAAFAGAAAFHARNPGPKGIFHRSTLEMAALDHRGQP